MRSADTIESVDTLNCRKPNVFIGFLKVSKVSQVSRSSHRGASYALGGYKLQDRRTLLVICVFYTVFYWVLSFLKCPTVDVDTLGHFGTVSNLAQGTA